MLAHKGHIKMHPIKAHVNHDGQGEVHPFVKIHFQHSDWESSHHKGHNVEWNGHEHWEHKVEHTEHEIEIWLKDHEGIFHGPDKFIGHAKFNIGKLTHQHGEWEERVDVHREGHEAGHIIFRMHFQREH